MSIKTIKTRFQFWHMKNKALRILSFKSIVLVAILLIYNSISFAQKVAEGKEVEITLYNLSTPHNTIYTHFENLQQDNYHPDVAAKAFLYEGVTQIAAEQFAIKVKHIFDGKVIYLDEHVFPTAVNYLDSTSQTHKYVLAQEVPEIYLVKVGDQWLYSKKTIQNIDRVFKKTYPFGTHKLLTVLPKIGTSSFMGLYIWQLVGLIGLILICFVLHKILTFVLRRVINGFFKKIERHSIAEDVLHVAKPVSLLIIFWLATMLLPVLQLPIDNYFKLIPLVLRATLPVFTTIALYYVVDLLATYFNRIADGTDSKMDNQIIPLIVKAIKFFVVVVGSFYTLYYLNVDIIPLLTGLSIGGLAFALAATDTIRNFFGSLMIFVDRPFQIGDWITTSEVDGIVEEVGFRSTRVRTFNDSLIYVPNAKLADSTIDNYGLRLFRRYKTTLGITYDTPADLVAIFVEGVRKIALKHPKTRKDNIRVNLIDLGANSLDIIFSVFFEVPDVEGELEAKQEIILDVIRLAETLGVEFAFPTQTLHMETFPGKLPLTPNRRDSKAQMQERMEGFFK